MKWTELSYQRKNLFLVGMFFVTLLFAYFFAFKVTIEMNNEIDELTSVDANPLNLPREIATLNQQIHLFDSLIDLNRDNYQTRLMNGLANLAQENRVLLMEVEEDQTYSDDQFQVFKTTFQGTFRSLLTLLSDIEASYALGTLKSINFNKEVDRRSKVESLKLTVFLAKVKRSDPAG